MSDNHSDDVVLDAEHHNAPKDANDDPTGITDSAGTTHHGQDDQSADGRMVADNPSEKRILDAVVALRQANDQLGELQLRDVSQPTADAIYHLCGKIGEWECKLAEEVSD